MTNVFTHFESKKNGFISFLAVISFLFISNLSNAQVLSVSVTGTNPTCGNFTNGSAEAVATGGWPGYTYEWSNGDTGPKLIHAAVGTYTVTVTDIDDVTATASITLTALPVVTATTVLTGDPCASTRGATVTAGGGTGNYTYLWDDGSTGTSVTGLSAGTHCATVTDSDGCAAVSCVTVGNPLNVDVTTVDSQCGGVCDGAANAFITGGTAPYTIAWSNGGSTPTIAPIPKGTYTVTVTDANGCVVTGTGIVDEPSPVVVTVNTTQPGCGAGSTGSISVDAAGGVTPYTYLWNTGANTSSISNLGAGIYTVIITDANNCAQDTSIIISAGNLNLNASGTDVSCGGTNDGSATAAATGGTAPYTYTWNNGQTGTSITGLMVGPYNVTVEDAAGCSAVATVNIGGGGANISVTASGSNISCNGAADGSATASSTAAGNLTYSWSNGMTGASISGLGAGTYTVNVSDGSGCSGSGMVTITEPAAIDLTANGTDENCAGAGDGSATATAMGGNGSFTYNWSNGSFNQTVTNLNAGTYMVTATDRNGCTATQSVTVGAGSSSVSVSVAGANASCNGANNGSASAAVSGGAGNYTYSWSNGMTGASISGLAPGTYTVDVADGLGCTGSGSVTITEPSAINISASATDAACATATDGTATASATGGNGGMTYAWSNGMTGATITGLGTGSYTVTATDSNGCTSTRTVTVGAGNGISVSVTGSDIKCLGDQDGSATAIGGGAGATYAWSNGGTTATINGLAAGTYSVMVTAANGCTGSASVTITEPSSVVSATASVTQVVSSRGANDGAATANGSGGTPGYTYAWSNGRTTQSINNLAPGTYTVTVTDSNGCTATASVTLEEPCDPFTDPGTLKGKQTACGPGYDPTVLMEDVAPTGGSGAIEYLWMSSTTSPDFVGGVYTAIPGATGATYDPGPIYVTTYFTRCVKREGCDFIEPTPICVVIENPDMAIINSDDTFCAGIPVDFSTPDAGAGATYSWNFGSTATPSTSSSRTPSVVFNGNNPGPRVTLEVTMDGCTGTRTKKVTADCPPRISFVTTITPTKHVVAEWSTELDEDVEYAFEVMKSSDGINFEPMFEMTAMGNADPIQTFSFVDHAPKKGHSYYKVQSTRLATGKVLVSEASSVRISWGADNSFIYPNPSANVFSVERFESFDSEGMVEILNMKGQVLQVIYLAADEVRKEIQLSKMNSGVYMVRVTYKDGSKPEVHRFIKR